MVRAQGLAVAGCGGVLGDGRFSPGEQEQAEHDHAEAAGDVHKIERQPEQLVAQHNPEQDQD